MKSIETRLNAIEERLQAVATIKASRALSSEPDEILRKMFTEVEELRARVSNGEENEALSQAGNGEPMTVGRKLGIYEGLITALRNANPTA